MSVLTAAASGLRALIEHRLVTRKVLDWSDSNTIPEKNLPLPIHISNANIVTSEVRTSELQPMGGRHQLVIDIDHPSWLVRSSTEGHYHLYVEVPGGIGWSDYQALLGALAGAGVIEQGYAHAAVARGFSAVRLPWIKKEATV